jgi:hypothetical protein
VILTFREQATSTFPVPSSSISSPERWMSSVSIAVVRWWDEGS